MNIESLRKFCMSLPNVTEDVKWGADLCFLIGEKMFCVTGLEGEFGASFKVTPDEFEEVLSRPNIIPAPYLARYKWVYVKSGDALSEQEWKTFVTSSYEMVKSKLPKRILKGLQD